MQVMAESWSASGKPDEAIDLLRPRLKTELAFVPAWELFGRALLQRAQEKLRLGADTLLADSGRAVGKYSGGGARYFAGDQAR